MEGFRRPLSVLILAIWRVRRWLCRAGIYGKSVAIPLLVIAIGANWLLDVLGVMPAVEWIWTGNVGALGLCTLLFRRWNRINFVVGTFLVTLATVLFLQQTGIIRASTRDPCLLIVFGGLLLIAKLGHVPVPFWMK